MLLLTIVMIIIFNDYLYLYFSSLNIVTKCIHMVKITIAKHELKTTKMLNK